MSDNRQCSNRDELKQRLSESMKQLSMSSEMMSFYWEHLYKKGNGENAR